MSLSSVPLLKLWPSSGWSNLSVCSLLGHLHRELCLAVYSVRWRYCAVICLKLPAGFLTVCTLLVWRNQNSDCSVNKWNFLQEYLNWNLNLNLSVMLTCLGRCSKVIWYKSYVPSTNWPMLQTGLFPKYLQIGSVECVTVCMDLQPSTSKHI